MEIITEAFSPLYPRAFIKVINSLDSPDNMLTNNALYPWGTSVGKDKHSLSIGSAKFKHERNAIMQHQPCHGAMRQSSNYIRSGFLSNLLCIAEASKWLPIWRQNCLQLISWRGSVQLLYESVCVQQWSQQCSQNLPYVLKWLGGTIFPGWVPLSPDKFPSPLKWNPTEQFQ